MNTHQKPSRQQGWSLIELMVVISIITILLAILINTAVEGKGPVEQTKVTLRAAMAVATEYEVTTTLKIDHLTPTSNPGPPVVALNDSISRFCYTVSKLDRTRTMLMSLGKDALFLTSGVPTEIRDGWGRKLEYYSGSDAVPPVAPPAGGPTSKAPYFYSWGPDGKPGTLNANNQSNHADSKDNMYSFQLD